MISVKKAYKLLFFSLLIFPPLYVFGPFFSDLNVSICGLLCLYILIVEKKLFKSKILNYFLIWNLYLVINSLLSINPLMSLEQSLFNFRFGFFAVSFTIVYCKFDNFLNYLLKSCLLVYLFVVIDALFQFLFVFNLLGYSMNLDDGLRISGIFRDIHILGFFIAYITPIIIALILYEKNFLYNDVVLNFIIFLSLVIIFISTERMTLIFFVFNIFIISLFIKKLYFAKYLLIFSILSVSIFVVFNDKYNYRFIKQPLIQSQQYVNFFNTSKKIFLDKPIFGVGTKNYRNVCQFEKYATYISIDNKKRNACTTHPHNFYLQLLSETGLVGTIPVIFIFIILFLNLIKLFSTNISSKLSKLQDHSRVILITCFSILFPIFINSSFFYNYTSILRYFIFSLILLFLYKNLTYNE